jgi:hypothetical protein
MDEFSNQIKLCSVKDILNYWSEHRLKLWQAKIMDQIKTLEKDILELETQLKIIQNSSKFLKILNLETLEIIRVELSKLINPKMIDYALNLKISQILKLNEKSLLEKLGELKLKHTYWKKTTPLIELKKQVEELVILYRNLNLPKSTVYLKQEELPNFKKIAEKSNWIIVTDKGWELTTDIPIRGRGFTGTLVGECLEFCTLIDSKGWMESVSVFAPVKKLGYEKDQVNALLVVPDKDCLVVGLGVDSTLICRLSEIDPISRRAFSKVELKMAITIEKSDWLVVVFENGLFHTFNYEELLKKVTMKVAAGWKDKLLGYKVGIQAIFKAYQGKIYYKGKITDIKTLSSLEGSVFSLGERNFCVNPSGQRIILKFDQIPEGLEFLCSL